MCYYKGSSREPPQNLRCDRQCEETDQKGRKKKKGCTAGDESTDNRIGKAIKGGKDQWHMSFEAAEDMKGYHSSLNCFRKPASFLQAAFTLANEGDGGA